VNDDLERAVRSLTIELADLKATLAEVRLAFVSVRPTSNVGTLLRLYIN
jgi:hypothetical protein